MTVRAKRKNEDDSACCLSQALALLPASPLRKHVLAQQVLRCWLPVTPSVGNSSLGWVLYLAGPYRGTVNLPQTTFNMRANSKQREPELQAWWLKSHLYEKLSRENAGEPYILHDGPPYANGDLHIGHALNKVSACHAQMSSPSVKHMHVQSKQAEQTLWGMVWCMEMLH